MSKYSKEFKEEALKLSDEIGVKKAALQLGLQYYTLADWRKLVSMQKSTLKKEKLYQIPTYRMKKEEVKTIVFRYIFIYYNRIRLYTGNPGCLPPSEYRIRNCEKTAA